MHPARPAWKTRQSPSSRCLPARSTRAIGSGNKAILTRRRIFLHQGENLVHRKRGNATPRRAVGNSTGLAIPPAAQQSPANTASAICVLAGPYQRLPASPAQHTRSSPVADTRPDQHISSRAPRASRPSPPEQLLPPSSPSLCTANTAPHEFDTYSSKLRQPLGLSRWPPRFWQSTRLG